MSSDLDRQSTPTEQQTRRQFVKGSGILGALAVGGTSIGIGVWRARTGEPARLADLPAEGENLPDRDEPDTGAAADPTLDTLADNVMPGGPGKDGIPSIDQPRFVSAGQADFLRDDSPVFGLVLGDEVRAYPQIVLVWHEIVNNVIAGDRLSVTYCPLTGSAVGFRGETDGKPLTFGTTGNLVNSNLLMYDRETDSEWPQLLGQSIRGTLKGERLEEVPLVWAPWKQWHTAHPDTVVLSTETGHARSYGTDPYGSYTPLSGYYEGGGPIFPVLEASDQLDNKDVMVAVKVDDARAAIPKDQVRDVGTVEFTLAGTRLLAVWDEELEAASVVVQDSSTDDVEQLPAANFLDVMWFAWYAFYPDSEVIE